MLSTILKKLSVSLSCLAISASSCLASASEPLNIKTFCEIEYEHLRALKDFLYRFNGNLPKIDDGKIAYIKRKMATYENWQLARNVRDAAFGDIFYDPDYIQWSIQADAKKLLNLIINFEKTENNFGKDELNFKALIEMNGRNKKQHQVSYQRIGKALEIADKTYRFIPDLESAIVRAEYIKREDIFAKSLKLDNPKSHGFEMAFFRGSAMDLPICWVRALELSTMQ